MSRFLLLCVMFICGIARAAVGVDDHATPDSAPDWVGKYRLRYALCVHGDLEEHPAKTAIAQVPTGGWLREDAADLLLTDRSGRAVPMAVLLHDPSGDTLIQFRRSGEDRWYWLYASNPDATGHDPQLLARPAKLKEAAERALLAKMAASAESGRRAGAQRDFLTAITKAQAEIQGAAAVLDEWQPVLEIQNAALQPLEERVAEAQNALQLAEEAHAPFAQVAEEKSNAVRTAQGADGSKPSAVEAARRDARAARLAAAPTATALEAARRKLEALKAEHNTKGDARNVVRKRVDDATSRKSKLEQTLESLRPQLEAAAQAAEEGRAALAAAVAAARAASDVYTEAAIDHDPRLHQEGLTVEFRRWESENIGSWSEVVKDLRASRRIQGNAVVSRVLQNVNPFHRGERRNYAVSYRGFLKIDKPGLYRFFVNGDDASFLFINGYRVTSRTGSNHLLFRGVQIYSVGGDIELEAGVHPFEIHQVVGNSLHGSGQCTLMWMTPGATRWSFVPREAFTNAMTAVVAGIEAFDGDQVATFESGVDDALATDGVTLFLTRFEAQGPVTRPDDLVWDFGDGPTGGGRSPTHLFFRDGAYEVSLKSHPKLPAFRKRVCVWTPPNPTGPHSLARAVEAIASMPIKELDAGRLNDAFHFLLICRHSTRWPVLERVCRKLLESDNLDIKHTALVYSSLMRAVAKQGRASDALTLAEEAMTKVGHIRTLRAHLLFEAAEVNREALRDEEFAARLYLQLIDENRRLHHPLVRAAAVARGDMYLDTGDMPRAAEAYRLAGTLAAASGGGAALDDPVRRGGLLRIAEQQIKRGNLRQTHRTLKRIESQFPQQKLEGMYRFLAGEADRHAGRYESALRHYEVLLRLRQWRGYRARAMQGIADTYNRMSRYKSAQKWLGDLEDSFPDFYRKQELGKVRLVVDARAASGASDDGAGGLFSVVATGFEPDAQPRAGHNVVPSMGIDGPHTFLIYSASRDTTPLPVQHLRRLPSQGTLWLELWYRERRGHPYKGGRRLEIAVDGQSGRIHEQRIEMDQTYGRWHKVATPLPAPPTQNGSVTVTVRNSYGLIEIDGLKISHVSDGQNDALRHFIEGADPQ